MDKLTFIRTHAAAVWYNKRDNKTIKNKLDEVDESIAQLNSNLSAVTKELKGKVIFYPYYGLEEARMSLYKDASNLYYIQLVLTINGDQKVINLSNFRL